MNENPKDEGSAADAAKVLGVSKAKLQKMARRAELERGWRVHPPGSRWQRRDGTTAYAGPAYGARVAGAEVET